MPSLGRLEDLPFFVCVAEVGSFTQAARRLGVTPSAVSKAISRMEDRLGVKLFNRTTRVVRLTDDGHTLYETCRDALDEIEHVHIAVSEGRTQPQGVLRVSVQTTLGRLYLIPEIPKFLERFPEMQIEIDLNDRLVEPLSEGFDVAVRLSGSSDARLIHKPLGLTRGILCATPTYLQRHGRPSKPADLSTHNVYVFSGLPGRPFELKMSRNGRNESVSVQGNLRLNNAEAILLAARSGKGIGAVVDVVAAPALQAGQMEAVLPEWTMPPGPPISIVYPRTRHRSAKVHAFVEFAAHFLQPLATLPEEP